jgi:hypothetical protein
LNGYDKTWRWFEKNYSGDVDANALLSDFGVEELVMIS